MIFDGYVHLPGRRLLFCSRSIPIHLGLLFTYSVGLVQAPAMEAAQVLPDQNDALLYGSTTRRVSQRRSHHAIPADHRIFDIAAVDAATAEFTDPRVLMFHVVQ